MNAILPKTISEFDREREKIPKEIFFFYRVFLTKLFYKGNHNLKKFYKNFLDNGVFQDKSFDDFVETIIKNIIIRGSISGFDFSGINITDSQRDNIIDGTLEDFNDDYEVFGKSLSDILDLSQSVKRDQNISEDKIRAVQFGIYHLHNSFSKEASLREWVKIKVGEIILQH